MLYDLTQLKTLSNNDETFIIDMLQTFRRLTPSGIDRMREYMAGAKHEAVGREAHKMIPGVSFLGAKSLEEILARIEENAKAGTNLEEMPAWIKQAGEVVTELISSFEQEYPLG